MAQNQTTSPEAAQAPDTLNDERAHRLAKREALYASGRNPYPEHSDVHDHVADIEASYAELEAGVDTEDVVRIGGRVMAKRGQGKIAFVVVRDATGDIQLFCRINDMSEEDWALIQELDLGDIVGVEGVVVRTRRGQLSVAPKHMSLLSKAVRPLPEKFHGLSDKETRYRQRYVDLIVNEDVRSTFSKRSAIISAFRRYMEDNGYMEVETPILQTIQGGATAKPFITHFNALNQECYLRIATELHLKRLLVGGFERVFEIGRIFRNEGMDLTHNPEFTTMEAYRSFSDLEGMKQLAEGVIKAAAAAIGAGEKITYQGTEIDLSGTWPSRCGPWPLPPGSHSNISPRWSSIHTLGSNWSDTTPPGRRSSAVTRAFGTMATPSLRAASSSASTAVEARSEAGYTRPSSSRRRGTPSSSQKAASRS